VRETEEKGRTAIESKQKRGTEGQRERDKKGEGGSVCRIT
jgi:hypothetical protein